MHVCSGIKRDGGRCTTIVNGPNDYCYQHDPARADERRRNASRAGRALPSKDVAGIKSQLQDLAEQVMAGEVDRSNAAVAGQLLNIKLRALELERKIREQDELLIRIEALEDITPGSPERRAYTQ